MSAPDMTNDELPEGWIGCSLGDVVDYGKTEKAEPEEIEASAWLLELEDIEKDTSTLLARRTFAERQSRSTKNRFAAGDVLYGKLRPYLNKALIADRPGYCTTEIIPLKTNAALDNRYLFYWLKHPEFLAYVTDVSHGLNMPRLGTAAGKAAPFVLAPLAEQKRIADKLEAVLGRVDACRARLARIPDLLKRFRQSVLAAATSGRLTEEWRDHQQIPHATQTIDLGADALEVPESWHKGILTDIIDPTRPLCYGVVQPGEEVADGSLLIRVQDMLGGRISVDGLRTISKRIDAESKRSRISSGDLLVSVVGTIGRTSIVPPNLEANIARAIARVACRSGVDSRWVNFWLSSDTLQWWLTSNSKEVARKTLNLSDLGNVPVAVPPIPEQIEIIRRIEALFGFADHLEARLVTAQNLVERLTPATLAKAFRGDLVPQDPDDEPAEKLLSRLRSKLSIENEKPIRQAAMKRRPTPTHTIVMIMKKSRSDDDVNGKPFLAAILRDSKQFLTAEQLYNASGLPLVDFYKQLAWEVEHGMIRDNHTKLEPVT